MSPTSYRVHFAVMAAFALLYCAVWQIGRGLRAVYWAGVALVCLAVHAVLGDDDVARP